jgi:hypothetical protein
MNFKVFSKAWLTSIFTLTATALVSADVLPNTTATGIVFLNYDRAAWATVAPSADFYDIHGTDLHTSSPSADAFGKRWIFPDRFEGTNWAAAVFPGDYLTPLPDSPLTPPAGGFALPVNTYGTNSFATNHQITTYNSTTDVNGYIGLGGSFRATSDFNEPGASVWWEHLALRQDPADSIWKLYATSGPGRGSVFELRNVKAETFNGSLHLSADYVFGNTDWLQFLQGNNGNVDTNAILGHIELIPAGAATLSAGRATINYNEAAWNLLASGIGPTPVLTLTAFFNQDQAKALTQSNLLQNVQANYSYTNEVYGLNGSTVTNLPTRYTQPTTLIYQRGNPTNQVGAIGLGGVARFAVFGGAAGSLLYGDYTLQYDSKRLAVGGTGWYLLGNIPPATAVFDLLNVSVTETDTSLSVSGDLGVSFEVANFLFSTPGDALANVGTFTFTGYTAPLTTPHISGLSVKPGAVIVRGANGLAGSSYSVLSSTDIALPLANWTTSATGVFDGNGASSNSITVGSGEAARFFLLQQP